MGQRTVERLREFLAQLPEQSQAKLALEYQRAIDAGHDVEVARFVLDELQKISSRLPSGGASVSEIVAISPKQSLNAPVAPLAPVDPATILDIDDAIRVLFECLTPFMTDLTGTIRPGQIRRSSLPQIWHWILKEGAPRAATEFCDTLRRHGAINDNPMVDGAVRNLQRELSRTIAKVFSQGSSLARDIFRSGAANISEDLQSVGAALQARTALEAFASKMPRSIKSFGGTHVVLTNAALTEYQLTSPQVLPFALSILMQRMVEPWQIARLAVMVAGTDDEIHISSTPFGVAVSIAIQDIQEHTSKLSQDIALLPLDQLVAALKLVHDGLRGLRTEVAFRNDSPWSKRLAAIRVEVSNVLHSRIANVSGRVSKILRHRSDRECMTLTLDPADVSEVASLMSFVAVCRNYASELAIGEITQRTYAEIYQMVDKSTESLVSALRIATPATRSFRLAQVQAAIRFSEVIFGEEFAKDIQRLVDNIRNAPPQNATRAS